MTRNQRPRVGIFGGTFDPVHWGHVRMGIQVIEALGLEKLLFVPCRHPPHKNSDRVTAAAHRFEMVVRATLPYPKIEACDVEMRRSGKSYTIDTLQELTNSLGREKSLVLILGEDSLAGISTWKDPEAILTRCEIAILPRPSHQRRTSSEPPREPALLPAELAASLRANFGPDVAARLENSMLPVPAIEISATEVREAVRDGRFQRVEELVPPAVGAYIRKHGLYAANLGASPSSTSDSAGAGPSSGGADQP